MIDEKIRKLLAHAADSGVSADEAASYAEKAAELAMQYNIDMDKLRKSDPQTAEVSYKVSGLAAAGIPGDRQTLILLGAGLDGLYGSVSIATSSHNEFSVSFAGQEHTVLLSQKWMSYLWEACKAGNKKHRQTRTGLSTGDRYKLDRSYRLLFATSVYKRLLAKRDAMRQQGVEGGDGKAVVLWLDNERRAVQLWVEQETGAKVPMKTLAIGHSKYDTMAAHAGRAAGNVVSLDDQIGSDGKRTPIGQQRSLTREN